ncbi:MAG: DUF2520 domain-containing protein [Balneolaceae bacterium]|nr:DUF2520 domain-containing protein [Balneolaceae bacterium]
MCKTISIIGTGALGQALARALHDQAYQVVGLFNRTISSAERLAEELDTAVANTFPDSVSQLGEISFITVPDDAIAVVAEKLANQQWDLSNKVIVHCSGNESSELLNPLKECGAYVAAFHPLQTFNKNSSREIFGDIYISLEGERPAVEQLEDVVERLGAHSLILTPEAKSYLHAAAVMASNYLVTLLQLSGEIGELGGIDHHETRKALHKLIKTTVENGTAENLSDVLSGPIARGDLQTVQKHLDLLEQNKRLKSLYNQLGSETVRLASQKSSIPNEKMKQLLDLLNN